MLYVKTVVLLPLTASDSLLERVMGQKGERDPGVTHVASAGDVSSIT